MEAAQWLEISMVVNGEMAEAVAEVMARYAPNGVVIESTQVRVDMDSEEAGHAEGPLRVSAYLPIDENLETTRRELEQGLWYLGRIRPLPSPKFRPVYERNWAEAWKKHYRPIPVGRKLIIVPAWMDSPDEKRIPIRIDPGMAFGTGTHPTTRLCLEFEEKILGKRGITSGMQVIDVGCGSGILSVAALKLGASRALGVDVDPEAIESARKNAQINAISERLELGTGSLSHILAGQFSIQRATLVLANILAPVIIRLLDEGLAGLLTPGGDLLLSGILEEQAAGVEAAARKVGLKIQERLQFEDWVALRATQPR
ncbi:MAG: 50S ribosomal protein L11 methyltransferase [Anaerolineales bacterium]|jgi:ribosomal protein L11 methyltransferase